MFLCQDCFLKYIFPSCFSTISLTIESPIPEPFFVKLDPQNFSEMWGRSFLEILQPVSFTIIVVVLFEIIVSFFSEYFIALSIMLMKTLTIFIFTKLWGQHFFYFIHMIKTPILKFFKN